MEDGWFKQLFILGMQPFLVAMVTLFMYFVYGWYSKCCKVHVKALRQFQYVYTSGGARWYRQRPRLWFSVGTGIDSGLSGLSSHHSWIQQSS